MRVRETTCEEMLTLGEVWLCSGFLSQKDALIEVPEARPLSPTVSTIVPVAFSHAAVDSKS